MHQLKSPLSDPNLLSKNTSKCEHCEARVTFIQIGSGHIVLQSRADFGNYGQS